MYSRYLFLKKLYPQYLILILKKSYYVSFDQDKDILNYMGVIYLDYLESFKVNYIVLDNLKIIHMKKFTNNKYLRYSYLSTINLIIELINSEKKN